MNYFWESFTVMTYLIAAWIVYFVIHSLLASDRVKQYILRINPVASTFYRLVYNLIALVLLVPVALAYRHANEAFLYGLDWWHQVIGMTLSLFGLYILVVGFKNYNPDEFLGTYQLKTRRPFHPEKLVVDGWNGIVRHPLYLGGLLFGWGLLVIWPTSSLLITNVLVSGYLIIGTMLEEKKLIREFGEEYRAYQKTTSMLIPIKWFRTFFHRPSHNK